MLSLLWNLLLMKINSILVDGAYENSAVIELHQKYFTYQKKYLKDHVIKLYRINSLKYLVLK